MRERFYPLPVFLSAICLASCMRSRTDTKVCRLTTGNTILSHNATIVYKLTGEGSTYVNHITYHDLLGPATVQRPGLPFTVTIHPKAGSTVGMEIDGIAMEGQLTMEQWTIIGHDTSKIRELCAD